jgi:hypothetical protein
MVMVQYLFTFRSKVTLPVYGQRVSDIEEMEGGIWRFTDIGRR